MARNKGTFPFAANFEVKAASPLDPRVLVERKAELISKDTWPLDGNTLYIYKGLLVSVQEENAIYMLVNPDKILSEDYSGWERKDGNQGGTSGGSIDVDLLHIIITVDRIEDIVNAQDNSISMSDDDVNAILNKKLIAAASPINGYVLADEVCYDDSVENPRKGFITFHYGNQNIKLAFDLTNKVYLGSESEITTIGEGGGNVEMHVISSIDSLQDAIAVGEDIWLDDEDINAILSNKQIATHTPYSGYIIATAVTLDDGKDWARIEFNYEGKLYSIYISINEACIVASESTITSLVNGGGSDSDLSDCLTKTEAEDTYLAQETFDEVIKRYATTEYVDEAINNIPQGGESYDDAEIKHDIENLKSGVSERNIKAIDIEGEEIEEPVIPGGGSGGSIDSEIIKQIQDTLDSHDELIEDLQNMKIDKENDDYYPNMSVGVADNLSGVDVVASEFTTRQSGGGAILDGTARIEAIKGNSIVWNQLATAPSLTGWGFPTSSVEAEILEKGEVYLKGLGVYALGSATVSPRIPLISGHTYLYSFDLKRSINERWGVYLGNNWWASSYTLSDPINAADTWIHVEQIATPSGELNRGLWIYPWNNTQLTEGEAWIKNVVVYDLTKMFGAGNEPETVDEFYQRLPIEVDPMLYNEGQMINLIPSGIKSYSADEEPIERFQDLSLIGTLFPDGMKSAGEFHDEIRYNKETQKWEKITRIGEVDLGSLNWSYARDIGYFYSAPSEDIGGGNTFKDINQQVVLINSVDFTGLHWSAFTNNYVDPRNNAISLFYTPDFDAVRANILCNEYTDVALFKEYLKGKKAYYVLNEPIVEELEFNGNLDYQVWNGGIEELVADNPSSALKADIAYGFNAHGKIKELEGRIDNLGGGGTGGSTITVDSALSDTSTNPVQNKIINAKFTELSLQVGTKVDATYVDNAIASAITNELNATFNYAE